MQPRFAAVSPCLLPQLPAAALPDRLLGIPHFGCQNISAFTHTQLTTTHPGTPLGDSAQLLAAQASLQGHAVTLRMLINIKAVPSYLSYTILPQLLLAA